MCGRHLLAIWERDFISLWILNLGTCRSWNSSIVVVCIVLLIFAVIIMCGSIIHPSWDRKFTAGGSWGNLSLQ